MYVYICMCVPIEMCHVTQPELNYKNIWDTYFQVIYDTI